MGADTISDIELARWKAARASRDDTLEAHDTAERALLDARHAVESATTGLQHIVNKILRFHGKPGQDIEINAETGAITYSAPA